MDKKVLTQYAILLIIVFLISYVYLNYFKESVEEVKEINSDKKIAINK